MAFSLISIALVVGSFVISSVSANCAHGTHVFPRDIMSRSAPVNNFTYSGMTGPLAWYGMDKVKNEACAKGRNQSPQVIDSSFKSIEGSRLRFDYPDVVAGDASLENLGTTLEVFVNGTMSHRGTQYSLKQYHFHMPSEHRLVDEFYPMEVHFVHQSATGSIAVIGVIVDLCETEGCTDHLLKSTFENLAEAEHAGDESETGALSFSDLKKQLRRGKFWTYSGSLTTPPCAENITWLLSDTFMYIDVPTWKAVKKVIKFNSRYTQDKLGEINLEQSVADDLNN